MENGKLIFEHIWNRKLSIPINKIFKDSGIKRKNVRQSKWACKQFYCWSVLKFSTNSYGLWWRVGGGGFLRENDE